MQSIPLLLLAVYFVFIASPETQADEQYESSKDVCQRCTCIYVPAGDLQMDCSSKGLKEIMADWPSDTLSTIRASFDMNNITELSPLPPTQAESIYISFSRCGITKLASALFLNAQNVKYLDLSWNSIGSNQLTPEVFRGRYNTRAYEPIALEELDLSHNDLHTLDKYVFEHTPNLTVLRLDWAKFRTLDVTTKIAIGSLTLLTKLHLAHNELTAFPEDMLAGSRHLRLLNLAGNKFATVPSSLGPIAHRLQILKLDGNPIEQLDDESFLGMEKLHELHISNLDSLRRILPNTFANLVSLKRLWCNSNKQLRTLEADAFGALINRTWSIVEMQFNGNGLRSWRLNVTTWRHLKVLELQDNRFECDCDLYHSMDTIPEKLKKVPHKAPTCEIAAERRTLNAYKGLTYKLVCPKAMKSYYDSQPLIIPHRTMRKILVSISIVLIASTTIVVWLMLRKLKEYKLYRLDTQFALPVLYTRAPISNRL